MQITFCTAIARSEILTEAMMKTQLSWHVTPHRVEGACYLSSVSTGLQTLMEAANVSESRYFCTSRQGVLSQDN